MPCQLQHSDTVFYWLNISALIIYERFLSNNFGPKMIRLKQHFWEIYLFGQTKNQYFVPIWALCRYSVGTLKTLRYYATQDTRVLAALWHSRNSGTQDTRKLTLTCQINGGKGGLSWGAIVRRAVIQGGDCHWAIFSMPKPPAFVKFVYSCRIEYDNKDNKVIETILCNI